MRSKNFVGLKMLKPPGVCLLLAVVLGLWPV